MTLAPGERFGSYETIELIGIGGMGEVYRARDVRLRRDVALKVLPDAQRVDSGALQRFEREALLLASLNHPNIATVHGFETSADRHALVMELVEGETLDDKLASVASKGLAIPAALQLARQIADALDAAHERGIVHRDLKPANIKIRPDGTVKVLDFGIAKVFAADATGHAGVTIGATQHPDAIVGTPSYMSPEQAAGGSVDRRTDIWAFGCVLYEMLTGTRAFEGTSSTATLARVLESEPDWSKLPPSLSPNVARLLRRCLEKDLRKRQRDAGDLRFDLEHALAEPLTAQRGSARSAAKLPAWIGTIAVLGILGVLGLRAWSGSSATASQPVLFSVLAPDKGHFETGLIIGSGAPVGGSISPDGRTLAFTARAAVSGEILLWVRPLDALEARALPGTEDAALPFWSPDGAAIGFFAQEKLKRIDVAAGQPQVLTDVQRGQGGTWNRSGVIVFGGGLRAPLRRVSAEGGEAVTLTALADGERAHRFPSFLPDGEHFLYHVESTRPEDSGVFVAQVGAPTGSRLLAADSTAVYAAPGHLLFVRQGTLFAQPFDATTLKISGEAMRLEQSVPAQGGAPAFSASETGVLTYRAGLVDSDQQQFAWFDRTGKVLDVVGPPGAYRGIDLSPDGSRAAVHDHQGDGGDIWVFEPRGTSTRVTFDPASDNNGPIWSPDGTRIAYGALHDGRWGLYHKPATGEGDAELLLESEIPKMPSAWSPDGNHLLYYLYESGNVHQWVLPLTGTAREPFRLVNLPSYEFQPQISPDGKWVAYVSAPSGVPQIYVRSFPSGQEARQVSTAGGFTPRWRADGKELYYMTAYDVAHVMAVPIETGDDDVVLGTAQELFVVELAIVPHSTTIQNFHTYAVAPDGERFLIPQPLSKLRGEGASTTITVVLDWPALLR